MMDRCRIILERIRSGFLDESFVRLYGQDAVAAQKTRYLHLLDNLVKDNPESLGMIVSAPGRTELGGNHTDHHHGHVLASAVDLDCVAAVAPVDSPVIDLVSEGFSEPIHVDLQRLEPRIEEQGTPEGLVRGMAAAFYAETGVIGGFRGYLHATCKPGTGLSTSAAFSVLIGGIFNYLYHPGKLLRAETLAQMAWKAENHFFGKPCGLMDQMSSAVGGTVAIDFKQPETPKISRIFAPKDLSGYRLVVVDTGGSHVELTPDYAAIPKEIRTAANVFGCEVARGLTMEQVMAALPEIRTKAGDRATLRLLHFIEENQRAKDLAKTLAAGSIAEYLELVRLSGESSALLLQNCSSSGNPFEQGVLLGLALTQRFCPQSVSRVHGGGFAGTIQAYIPEGQLLEYIDRMNKIFGKDAVIPLSIGRPGVCGFSKDGLALVPCACGNLLDATTYHN